MYVVTQEVSCSLSGPHLTNSEVLDNQRLATKYNLKVFLALRLAALGFCIHAKECRLLKDICLEYPGFSSGFFLIGAYLNKMQASYYF